MTSSSQPATPINQVPQTIVSDSPTGVWQHPRLLEIDRRLKASTFGERQIKSIVRNSLLIVVTLAVPSLLSFDSLSFIARIINSVQPTPFYITLGLLALALVNLATALSPLIKGKDDLSDIPLTPTQRALLGLGPASQPATPGSHYITPPRYSRSPTPRSRSASGSPFSDSPLSGYGNVATGASPSASPLFQKAMGRERRRPSLGTPSPLALNGPAGQSTGSLLSSLSKPTPRKDVSVSLPSRWVYERGKSSPSTLRSVYL